MIDPKSSYTVLGALKAESSAISCSERLGSGTIVTVADSVETWSGPISLFLTKLSCSKLISSRVHANVSEHECKKSNLLDEE